MTLRKTLTLAALLAALAFSHTATAGCFTVYDGKGKLVRQAVSSPVDLQYHLHRTLPAKYGEGATMVFSSNVVDRCIDYSQPVAVKSKKGRKGRKGSKNSQPAETTVMNPDEVLENLAASHRREIPGYGSVLK